MDLKLLILIILSTVLYELFWVSLIKDFKMKNIFYVLSPILTIGGMMAYRYFIGDLSFKVIPYVLLLLILINLSFIDCKYFEISGNSYWFLLLPAFVIVILNYTQIFSHIASFVICFVLFWLIDKVVGIEKIGGADVKILLILALTINFYDVIVLILYSFIVDLILFIVKYPIDKIFDKGKTKIPMIISITVSWVYIIFFSGYMI